MASSTLLSTFTSHFAYNGDAVRTSKTVDGDTTEYVLDPLATLPVVISDTEAVYFYGLDIIAQQQTERLYYVHDGLGSVRQLVDATGQIETNYAYDPFGVPLLGGDVYNPYQYTGEAWDAEVELLYLRARYYQPEVGRFITKDLWAGDYERPGTLDSYSYALNNPSNLVDPTGHNGEDGENGQGADPLGLRGHQVCEYDVSVAPPEPMPFEEWKVLFPADPYRGLDEEHRQQFMREAQWTYFTEASDAPGAARGGTNNTLPDIDMLSGEIGRLAVANRGQPPFIFTFLIDELKMDADQITNFEPYFLTLLKNNHKYALNNALRAAYEFMQQAGWNQRFTTALFRKMGIWAYTAMPYSAE
jgi:RHS repeat-associated protein